MTLTESAITVLEKRYLLRTESGELLETPDEMFRRVSHGVAPGDDDLANAYYQMMSRLDFLPNSPALMNMGTQSPMGSACFVLPYPDDLAGIFDTVKSMAMIQRLGGGTGFPLQNLRPEGDFVFRTNGQASGPISFLSLLDDATRVIKQGGKRRGANMAVMTPDHPDIRKFITCKDAGNTQIVNFNISVWIPDWFMKCVLGEEPPEYDLINPRNGKVAGRENAQEIWDLIVRHAWETGDPGVIFADVINRDNPTPWIGDFETVNPCGEQPLLEWEACVLGSINLVNFVVDKGFDYAKLIQTVRLAVKFLDGIVEYQDYTLPQIEAIHKNGNRKIGLGVMGWADALIKLRIAYASSEAVDLARVVMSTINSAAEDESEMLGATLGTYPNFKSELAKHAPRRNATVTTIAPTGTISIIAGISSGIEPLFALAIHRENVLEGTDLFEVNPQLFEALSDYELYWGADRDDIMEYVREHGVLPAEVSPQLQALFATANDIAAEWHIAHQAAFQEHVHNAVSKTINLPNEATVEDVDSAYKRAYVMGCKGVTIYRDGSKSIQVLHRGMSSSESSTGPSPRPPRLEGFTEKLSTPLGNLYFTVNHNDAGPEPFEVLAHVGRSGSDVQADTEAMARLISLGLRSGIDPMEIADQLIGIQGRSPSGFGPAKILSLPDAMGKALAHATIVAEEEPETWSDTTTADLCPDCHSATLAPQEGCLKCMNPSCGYSEC